MARVPPHRHLLDGDRGVTTTAPPLITTATTSRDHGGKANTSNANFDTNMVIILGALLCALICALGLNSIIRCTLRCIGRLTSPTQPDQAEPTRLGVGYRGLKRSTIRQIPVAIYSKNPGNRKNDNNNISDDNFISTDCTICLGEFVEGEKIRVLPMCKHGFHIRCIDTWLLSHSSCPTCRQSVSEWAGNGPDSLGNGSNGGDQRQFANESG